MAKISWVPQDRDYKSGISNGVLYLDGVAVAWNGLVSVEELDNSSTDTTLYFDGKRHRLPQDPGNFMAKITAFYYPEEFEPYDGLDSLAAGQNRSRFGLSYRVETARGYQLHLVYNALVFPTTKMRSTENNFLYVDPFEWTLVTTGIDAEWTKHLSHIYVDSDKTPPHILTQLENLLYGTPSSNASLPDPDYLIDLFEDQTSTRVVYNGDGTFTVTAPSSVLTADEDEFELSVPSTFYVLDDGTYIMRSYREGV